MKQSLLKTGFIPATILVLLLSFTYEDVITFEFISPHAKSVYKVRDTVWIKANINSTGALHNVNIKVINLKDSSVVYSKQIHSHSTMLTVQEFYINPVVEKADMLLSISTTGHEGKETARSVIKFKCLAKTKKK